MSLTIRGKVLLGASLIVVILIGPTIYSVLVLRRISSQTTIFLTRDAAAGVTVSQMLDTFEEARRQALGFRANEDPAFRPRFRQKLESVLDDMQRSLDSLRGDAERSVETSLIRVTGTLRRYRERALAEVNDPAAFAQADADVPVALKQLSVAVQNVVRQRTAETKELARDAARLTLVATVIGFLVAAGLWAVLLRSLSRPLKDLLAGTERIAAGRFDEMIPVRAVDELGRLADAFNRMGEALGEIERLKAEFISTASHGLRTPLACAKGYLSALGSGRQGSLDEESLRSVRRIEEEVDRVTRFVDQLLDFGRLRSGRLPMAMREVPAAALFTSIGRSFDALAEEKGIAYRIRVGEGLPSRITADPDRLGEALINLLGNAFKYTPRGGRVAMSVAPENGWVRVEVEDTGPGIPSGEVSLIFERYFRGGGVVAPGTGLGLAISKEIVERHGGRIWAECEKGSGARFIFKVPVTPAPRAGGESGKFRLASAGPRKSVES
jgi:signal transduction histidine kinase